MDGTRRSGDPDPRRVRARVWRTVWICVAVVVVLLGLFVAEHVS